MATTIRAQHEMAAEEAAALDALAALVLSRMDPDEHRAKALRAALADPRGDTLDLIAVADNDAECELSSRLPKALKPVYSRCVALRMDADTYHDGHKMLWTLMAVLGIDGKLLPDNDADGVPVTR